jgi:hypothetical protein
MNIKKSSETISSSNPIYINSEIYTSNLDKKEFDKSTEASFESNTHKQYLSSEIIDKSTNGENNEVDTSTINKNAYISQSTIDIKKSEKDINDTSDVLYNAESSNIKYESSLKMSTDFSTNIDELINTLSDYNKNDIDKDEIKHSSHIQIDSSLNTYESFSETNSIKMNDKVNNSYNLSDTEIIYKETTDNIIKDLNTNILISDSYTNNKTSQKTFLNSDTNSISTEIYTSDLYTKESEKHIEASTEFTPHKQSNSYSENIIDSKTNKKNLYDSSNNIYNSNTN